MAEDPKFLLHFKTLAKFNEKLADGTVSANRHLCFIKDEKMIWCRGEFYADNTKLENLSNYYDGWSISQSNPSNITITLTGKQWNSTTRQWDTISKPLTLTPATQSTAGLMSAEDKARLDNLKTNNLSDQTFSANASNVIVTTKKDAGAAGVTTTTSNFPTASTSLAGVVTAQDKRNIDGALQRTGGNMTGNITANQGVTISCSGFFQTSDRDLKENVKELDASNADKIQLKEFDYIFGGHGYGAIAQEVEVYYPELVVELSSPNDYKTLNYTDLLVIKVKWLEDQVRKLSERLSNLENK